MTDVLNADGIVSGTELEKNKRDKHIQSLVPDLNGLSAEIWWQPA